MDAEKINRETYLAWKADCEAHGTTPWEILETVRPYCTKEYARTLENFIRAMEAKMEEAPATFFPA